jgi:hypothetical protein
MFSYFGVGKGHCRDMGNGDPAIAPAFKLKEKVSPETLAGWGFLWSTRTVALLYNPKLIPEAELSKTWKQKGDPKYR